MTATTPDATGHFGPYGGRVGPRAPIAAVGGLRRRDDEARADPDFTAELHRLLRDYAGRPSLLYDAERFSAEVGARVLLKREDLNHTGAHKINNVIGQALLTRRMGKRRVIAETGAGQHGVATATAAALFGFEGGGYMGGGDVGRQGPDGFRMGPLGAEGRAGASRGRPPKD